MDLYCGSGGGFLRIDCPLPTAWGGFHHSRVSKPKVRRRTAIFEGGFGAGVGAGTDEGGVAQSPGTAYAHRPGRRAHGVGAFQRAISAWRLSATSAFACSGSARGRCAPDSGTFALDFADLVGVQAVGGI